MYNYVFCWQCLAIARKLLDTSDEAVLKSYGLVRCMSLSAGTRGHHIASTRSYIHRAYYILLYYFYYFSLGVDSIYIWCKLFVHNWKWPELLRIVICFFCLALLSMCLILVESVCLLCNLALMVC